VFRKHFRRMLIIEVQATNVSFSKIVFKRFMLGFVYDQCLDYVEPFGLVLMKPMIALSTDNADRSDHAFKKTVLALFLASIASK